jgi:phosphoribosylaminoimidazole carboxylase PurE protein
MAWLHIFVGSGSDLKHLKSSGMSEVLDGVDISYAVHVCSAHRNADELAAFVKQICDEGAQMFIGIAGMAAALPGALAGASKMKVPVLAVPLDEHGIDSCLYMPPGVPVATMGVGTAGLLNAAIFACQALVRGSESQQAALERYLLNAAAKKPAMFNISKADIRPVPAT